MENLTTQPDSESSSTPSSNKRSVGFWVGAVAVVAIVAGTIIVGHRLSARSKVQAVTPPPPAVIFSHPLEKELSVRLRFLGQYSAVDRVELRAQVGGILTRIGFKDGAIVHKGDFLFEIDPTPYEIKLKQATADLKNAQARFDFATQELYRAQTLKQTDAGSAENVEQRTAEKRTAQAAIESAESQILDARFDLDRCRIVAPFTGRVGTHLVSTGNLISGSRAGSGSTTLLATLVSLNPIYLNFDMSEADYMTFLRERQKQKGTLADKVDASLSDEAVFSRQGTLNFIDNSLDRASGTIHARATMPNSDLMSTPGAFARVQLALSIPVKSLLVPDASVLVDQSEHLVLTIGPDNVVTSKKVEIGDLRYGLRVIRSGLSASDRVIIGGIPAATTGAKVSPRPGSIQLGPDQGRS